jgi:hypothetical protein
VYSSGLAQSLCAIRDLIRKAEALEVFEGSLPLDTFLQGNPTPLKADRCGLCLLSAPGEILFDIFGDRFAGGFVHGFADGFHDGLAGGLAGRLADELADRVADKVADRVADGLDDGIADGLADGPPDPLLVSRACNP